MADTTEIIDTDIPAGMITLTDPGFPPQITITLPSQGTCLIMAGFIGDSQMDFSIISEMDIPELESCSGNGTAGARLTNKTGVTQIISLTPYIRNQPCNVVVGNPLPLQANVICDCPPKLLVVMFKPVNDVNTSSITLVVQVGVDI